MHSVRTIAGISNGPERVSSVGRVARRKSEHESKEEKNREKVVESDYVFILPDNHSDDVRSGYCSASEVKLRSRA